MPSCATTLSTGRESGGKRNNWTCGAIAPNKEGPSSTPAIISPMTCGWRSQRRTTQPHRRQAARITNICRKKIMAGGGRYNNAQDGGEIVMERLKRRGKLGVLHHSVSSVRG